MKKVACGAILVCILSACFAASQEVSKRLTNQDIIDMVKLGLSNDVIVAKIRSAHGQDQLAFDTGVDGLKSLKVANVPDDVIKVMINPAPVPISIAPPAGRAPVAPDPNFPPPPVGRKRVRPHLRFQCAGISWTETALNRRDPYPSALEDFDPTRSLMIWGFYDS